MFCYIRKKFFIDHLQTYFDFFNEMPRNLMISGHLRFSFFSRCGTFVQRRSEENEIQAHSRQSHSLSKTTFLTSCADGKNRRPLIFIPFNYFLTFSLPSNAEMSTSAEDGTFISVSFGQSANALDPTNSTLFMPSIFSSSEQSENAPAPIKNDEKDSYAAKNSDSDKKPEEKQDNK